MSDQEKDTKPDVSNQDLDMGESEYEFAGDAIIEKDNSPSTGDAIIEKDDSPSTGDAIIEKDDSPSTEEPKPKKVETLGNEEVKPEEELRPKKGFEYYSSHFGPFLKRLMWLVVVIAIGCGGFFVIKANPEAVERARAYIISVLQTNKGQDEVATKDATKADEEPKFLSKEHIDKLIVMAYEVINKMERLAKGLESERSEQAKTISYENSLLEKNLGFSEAKIKRARINIAKLESDLASIEDDLSFIKENTKSISGIALTLEVYRDNLDSENPSVLTEELKGKTRELRVIANVLDAFGETEYPDGNNTEEDINWDDVIE